VICYVHNTLNNTNQYYEFKMVYNSGERERAGRNVL